MQDTKQVSPSNFLNNECFNRSKGEPTFSIDIFANRFFGCITNCFKIL